MSQSRYDAYKDSGVAWLGQVPAHWNLFPMYSLFSVRDEPNKGLLELNLLSLSYGNIVNKDIDSLDGLLPASFETYQVVHPGDIVFRFTDLQNDKRSLRSALVRQKGIITSAYLAVKPISGNTHYYNYLFRAYDVLKVFYSMGGGLRQSMNYQDVKRLPITLPPLAEQQAIAAFLDRECARIDALVVAQQRMIALSKEKRQALISHAVTRGLDPAAPYKDSGVAWLGQVPAHWEVVALKRTLDIQNGHDYKHIESENGYPVIGSGGIFAFASDYLFDGESILLGRKGTIDKPLHFRGKFWTVDTMFWSKIATGVYGRFIYYVATEIPFAMYSTNTALPSMAKSVLEQHLIPLPPLAEQQAIAAFLDRECARIDTLIERAEQAIVLLRERRSALIAAAVTGQIRVGNEE